MIVIGVMIIISITLSFFVVSMLNQCMHADPRISESLYRAESVLLRSQVSAHTSSTSSAAAFYAQQHRKHLLHLQQSQVNSLTVPVSNAESSYLGQGFNGNYDSGAYFCLGSKFVVLPSIWCLFS